MTRLSVHAAFWLTIARIYLGAFWAVHGLAKLVGPAQTALPAWYRGPLVPLVAHNFHTWMPILAAAEVLAGVFLIFGLLTRLSALAAMFFAGGFILTKGTYASSFAAFAGAGGAAFVLALVQFALAADFGVDGMLRIARRRREPEIERVEAQPVDVQWPQ